MNSKHTQHKPENTNNKTGNATGTHRSGRKTPKKITENYLHNAGLYYLQRYASSASNFRAVMLRKVKRSCLTHTEQNYEECARLVDKLTEKFIAAGLLDDQLYTRSMVTSLRRRGKSTRAIHSTLAAKGLSAGAIEHALDEIDTDSHENWSEAERQAALTFARKKRLGPWRGEKKEDLKKELSQMARAGFSYETSRNVLHARPEFMQYD